MTSTTTRLPPPPPTGNRRQHNRQPSQQPPSSHQYYYSGTPSYYASTSSSPSLIKGCCCCLFLLFSLIALIILAVILVVVLAVKPKKPQFDLRQVAVENIAISPGAAAFGGAGGGATVSLSIRLVFTAANPNKVGIKYGESRFTVMYRGVPLGRGSVPAFYQPAHSVKNTETVVSVDRVNLMQADASDLIKDASVYDKVELRVLGDVSAKIRIISFDSPGVQVSVDCAIVISPRKQALTYKQCGFDGLSV
ncbi:hypothetical protein RND81_09G133300 [Saponaria officinalis]|uniref:Late embryogenesis abundant protein LEA-2 subgroup domain-containing protein n=1 Tax=Saponaria officinalis TaxID=3572 RepID=A0AAW1IMC0_SAPOF